MKLDKPFFMYWGFFFLFMFAGADAFSQISKADSLILLIRKAGPLDTNKVNYLNDLAIERWGDLDTAILCSSNALEIAKKIKLNKEDEGWLLGMAKSNYRIGVFYFDKGDFTNALFYNTEALKIWEKIEKKSKPIELPFVQLSKAKSIGEIGSAWYGLGNYPKALEFEIQALKTYLELKHERGIGNQSGNIGNIYKALKNYPLALTYYLKSYEVGKKANNLYDMSIDLRNIASIYNSMNDFKKAYEYAIKALNISKELGNEIEIAMNLSSVGSAINNTADYDLANGQSYEKLKENYEKAMDYYQQSLKLEEEQGNLNGACFNYANIGGIYLVQKNYIQAEKKILKALSIAEEMDAIALEVQMHEGLSDVYAAKGDFKKSLEHYKLFTEKKDSIFNEENEKELTRHEMNYEFEKKEAAQKAIQEKNEAIADAEKKKQNILFWLVTVIMIAISIIAIFILRSLKVTKKQKKIIEFQKEMVEEKQKSILDSIHYAKRIQKSLLPNEKYIHKNLQRLNKNV